jgi:hypothetical protein
MKSQRPKNVDRELETDANADPLTGEPGSHPVGVGVGAALGGAGTGALAGAAAGPVGAGVGALVGGIVGAVTGKAVAEDFNPTEESAYWRDEYRNRDYYDPDLNYETDYEPAYQYGWESRTRYADRNWTDVEPELERDWQSRQGTSTLSWDRARSASYDAWQRLTQPSETNDGAEEDFDDGGATQPIRPR